MKYGDAASVYPKSPLSFVLNNTQNIKHLPQEDKVDVSIKCMKTAKFAVSSSFKQQNLLRYVLGSKGTCSGSVLMQGGNK